MPSADTRHTRSGNRGGRRSRNAIIPALLVIAVVAGLVISLLPTPSRAASDRVASDRYVAGRVIVGFKARAGLAVRTSVASRIGATAVRPLGSRRTDAVLMSLPEGMTVDAAIGRLGRMPAVRYAERDWRVKALDTSNDPYVLDGALWGMYGPGTSPSNAYGTGAVSAWANGDIGSRSVVIGIIDEGYNYTHPDLAANIWTNPWDVADGLDNDGNGYVDDIHGWDFFSNDATVDDGAGDDHGTHVAGTIGGVGGNGIGVAGVNWKVSILSGRFLDGTTGTGDSADAVKAIDYVIDMKKRHGLNVVAKIGRAHV